MTWRRGRRLGVDVGDARIGVASCDPDGLIATPVETVKAGEGSIARLVALVEEYEAFEVVVGLPLGMSGREGPAAVKVRAYATALAEAVSGVSVRLIDERLSTVAGQAQLHASGRTTKSSRSVIDQAAAVVILQSAIDAEKTRGTAPGEVVDVVTEGNDG
ncbi:MAG: Holliday junction resolvase RuvX [Aeromicrobium sp.]